MKSFRIGLIGAGIIAREHALSLVRNKRVASLGIYDADPKRAARFSLDFRAMTARSTDELIDRSDIVWVCSPPSYHVDAIRRACSAGKAIFCEKPLALTLADARAIRDAVKRAKVPFFMGHSNRFNVAFIRMKEIADRGDLGDLTAIWSQRTGYLDRKVHPAWRFDDKLSGGVIVELGIHELDFSRWVGGDWKQVYATGSDATLNPGKFQDTATATGPFRRAGAARVHVSWSQPRYLWQRGIDGTRGSLFWDDSDYNHVHLLRAGRKPKLYPLGLTFWKDKETGENFSLRDQAHAVLAALEAGKPAPVTLGDGLEAIKLALAIRDSIRTAKIVPFKAGGSA
jgi:predicted dehydrogenase